MVVVVVVTGVCGSYCVTLLVARVCGRRCLVLVVASVCGRSSVILVVIATCGRCGGSCSNWCSLLSGVLLTWYSLGWWDTSEQQKET